MYFHMPVCRCECPMKYPQSWDAVGISKHGSPAACPITAWPPGGLGRSQASPRTRRHRARASARGWWRRRPMSRGRVGARNTRPASLWKMKENETSRKRYNFIVYDIVVGSNSGYKKSMEFKGIQGMFLNQSFWSDIFVPYPSHYSLIRLTQTSEIPDVFPGVHAGDLCCRQVESSQKGSAALSHPHTPPGWPCLAA